MAIRVSTDHEHDLHVLHLSDEPVVRTTELDEACLVDIDAEGRPVAVEILVPEAVDLESVARELGFEDQLAEAKQVLADAGVRLGSAAPTNVVVTTGSSTTWTQTSTVASSQQIPAQSIDLIPALAHAAG
jgi:uncharacterized protein YuzE